MLSRADLRSRCLDLPGASETYPFGEEVAVYKVEGKVFALLPEDDRSPASISLKCDPDDALALRARYVSVTPGYHLNKRHWNTVRCDGEVGDAEVGSMIEESWRLVVASLPKATRARLSDFATPGNTAATEKAPSNSGPPAIATSDPLTLVRDRCLALPLATERLSHGSPTFFVDGKKTFVMYLDDHHGDGRLALWVAAAPGVQEEMVGEDPVRFFRPPYVGGRGWLGVRLDRDPDWAEIGEIITDAYRVVAPKKLLALLK